MEHFISFALLVLLAKFVGTGWNKHVKYITRTLYENQSHLKPNLFGQSTTASWYACSRIEISDQNTTMSFWTEQFGQKQMNLTSGLRYYSYSSTFWGLTHLHGFFTICTIKLHRVEEIWDYFNSSTRSHRYHYSQ